MQEQLPRTPVSTTTRKWKVELRLEQQPRTTQEQLSSRHIQHVATREPFIDFYEGFVNWGVFLWFRFFSRAKEKLPGAIFNMLCMARRVNVMDDIHK